VAFGKFIQLLEGMPLGGFKECAGCKKIYFYPHERKKNFCTSKCYSRSFAKQKRESDREGYNEYQKKLMSRIYAAKKREKLGPKVKIGRRKVDRPQKNSGVKDSGTQNN
jgi:hypothetical protein